MDWVDKIMYCLIYFGDVFVKTQLEYGFVIGLFIWICIFEYTLIRNHGKDLNKLNRDCFALAFF